MTQSDKILPYTSTSFEIQSDYFKRKLNEIGVNASYEESENITFLSRRKYDRYDHFSPGENFMVRLLSWLKNFKQNERDTAFKIVKNIKFIDEYELRKLTISTFENIKYVIISELDLGKNNTWYSYIEKMNQNIDYELSKTIFIACTDDIRFDFFRRYAMNTHPMAFKKDNFIEYYKLNKKSQQELPYFDRIVLLDQLAASGTTAIREEEDEWHGKFPRFFKIWDSKINDKSFYYCPYILSNIAEVNINERLSDWKNQSLINNIIKIIPTSKISVSPCISDESGLKVDKKSDVAELCKSYYHYFKEDEHTKKVGGVPYGYGEAGLTLILQSNCPNNSLPIIWHNYNKWHPLFPRVSHHR